MSDVGKCGCKACRVVERLDKTPFFGFSKPYLNLIGKERIFSVVYFIMAAVSLIIPLVVIFLVVDSGMLAFFGGRGVVAFILSWLVIAFACWIGFQLWWNRRHEVAAVAESEFTAIPICAGILRTFGEWVGTLTGIIGFGVGIIAVFILGDTGILAEIPGFGAWAAGPVVIFAGPVIGFLYIVLFRLLAELLKVVAALANNTKAIASNLKAGDGR